MKKRQDAPQKYIRRVSHPSSFLGFRISCSVSRRKSKVLSVLGQVIGNSWGELLQSTAQMLPSIMARGLQPKPDSLSGLWKDSSLVSMNWVGYANLANLQA